MAAAELVGDRGDELPALPARRAAGPLPPSAGHDRRRPGSRADRPLAAWLVSDERGELRAELRMLAATHGVQPAAAATAIADLVIEPHPVVHTSHPAWGYLLRLPVASAVWAPEFCLFPAWAAGADLRFADAAGWNRPIRFAHGAGGHMAALDVAEQARQHQVKRLVFAHIGRPSLRAIDAGYRLPFGEWRELGRTYRIPVPGPSADEPHAGRRLVRDIDTPPPGKPASSVCAASQQNFLTARS